MKQTGKKGLYYSIDAILAGMLLIGTAILLLNSPFYEKKTEQKSFFSQDGLNTLSELRLDEVQSDSIQQDINNGLLDGQRSVLEQIGEYWALNETSKAQTLFNASIDLSLFGTKKTLFALEDDEIYSTGSPSKEDILVSRRMIAGINKGNPITGTSASAYLTKVRDKKTASYAYFGGFIGQGNISTNLYLPTDFNSSKLITSEFKAEVPGNFYIYINSVQCGILRNGQSSTVNVWSLSECNTSFIPGTNLVSLKFTSSINESYISGGYIKAVYVTDTLKENITFNTKRYEFPEIHGMINIYDSISAQGVITDWILNLTFYNEYDTFMTLGNETIFYAPGHNTTQNVVIIETDLTLPPTQIPLRVGVTNLSNITVITLGAPSDSILVTDVSGSMTSCGLYENETRCEYEYKGRSWWWWWSTVSCEYNGVSCNANECSVSPIYSTRNHELINESVCSQTLMDIAKNADRLFVDIIFNQSLQHRIGLSAFSTNANDYLNLTNINATLKSEINTYVADGATCACCGINRARVMVNTSPNKKFIIFLSDGEPNYYCSSYTDYTGTSNEALGVTWAINSAHYACTQNITVYTIGFGNALTSTGHEILRSMSCNSTSNGTFYYNASNTNELAEIYKNISDQILLAANFSSQTLEIIGNYTPSQILPNSYIDITYIPYLDEEYQSKISLTFESEQFNSCNQTIPIPNNILIRDAYLTSFSGEHWSKELIVNNNIIYNLSEYGADYILLGDPFQIQVPSALIIPGANNNFELHIGDSPTNSTSCSNNNSFIYTGLINSSTERTDSLEFAEGCNWTIESQNGAFSYLLIPNYYTGTSKCSYTTLNRSYNPNDAYDLAMYNLLHQLDPDNSGAILVDLQESDLDITLTTIGSVPYLWGPAIAKFEVWQ